MNEPIECGSWNSIPRFLLCDQFSGKDDDRMFVFHTRNPRFLLEFYKDREGEIYLIDAATEELPKAIAAARSFFEDAVQ